MGYRWVAHTAELELHIDAATEEAVFEDALHALGEVLDDGPDRGPAAHRVEVSAPDRAALLARWMEELGYLAETEDLVPERMTRLELGPAGLHATVEGHRGEPRHLVKGVTYHRLAFERGGQGYEATVVLDV